MGCRSITTCITSTRLPTTKFIGDLTALLGNKGYDGHGLRQTGRGKLLEEILTPPELIGKLKLGLLPASRYRWTSGDETPPWRVGVVFFSGS